MSRIINDRFDRIHHRTLRGTGGIEQPVTPLTLVIRDALLHFFEVTQKGSFESTPPD